MHEGLSLQSYIRHLMWAVWVRARADMESASARRQSIQAAGVKLPEGLSASCAVGVTRGAMVGDQSLRKARGGLRGQSIGARSGSSCERADGHL